MTLDIEQDSCIKCGKCVRVCPSAIFTQSKVGDDIGLVHVDNCIVCGHCAAVCPTNSVVHSEFGAEKVHPINYTQMPTPEQVMLLMKMRRSNRTMTKKPIPAEVLDTILEAGHRAPTGSNSQSVSFTLITDPRRLRQVSDYTINVFSDILKKVQNPLLKPILKLFLSGIYKYIPVFERLKQQHEAGEDPILRNATALILIHTPKSNRFGCEDSNLAYQNASLMAESLGISQVYMGFVLSAIKQQKKNVLAHMLGVDGQIYAMMALGVPAFRYPKYIDREEIKIQKI